ncbi:MAG: TIGR01777 family protein [Bacteroidetes bacterium]|nr:TIGR01777 family protein [Bacteroidota bacterium]
MKKILIAGGSGLVGRRLTTMLIEKGYEVTWLSRRSTNSQVVKVYEWNVENKTIDDKALENVHAIVSLAGCGIADKAWTDARKKEIVESRTHANQLLLETCLRLKVMPQVFVGASAIGAYGLNAEKIQTEEMAFANNDFLSTTCKAWEQSSLLFESQDIRTIILRIGIVLSTHGGAMKEMLKPLLIFTGVKFGDGKMITSWIHIDDVCNMFMYAIDNQSISGVYNAVSPEPVKNITLVKTLAAHHPLIGIVSAPEQALKLMLGERAAMVMQNLNVSCKKIVDAGYRFLYPDLTVAVNDILKNKK